MAKIKLDLFNELIDTNALKEVYETELSIDNKNTLVEMWFLELEKCEESTLSNVEQFVSNLEKIQKKTFEKITTDFKNGGEVKRLIEEHLEQFNDDDKKTLGIKNSMLESEQIDQIFSQVHLKRVGIYPEEKETFAIFDYSMGSEITQYLFVVSTNSLGEITDDVYIES